MSGQVLTAGAGWQGQMGNDTLEYKNKQAIPLAGVPRIQRLAAGYYHNAALGDDGEWYVWGCNETCQLGVSDTPQIKFPTKLSHLVPDLAGKQIVDVEGGYVHTVLRFADGSVYTMGGHTEGQRGLDPELEEPPLLNKVEGLPGPAEGIASGNHHVLVIVAGRLYGFGSDEFGQVRGCGDPDNADSEHCVSTPVLIQGLPSDDPVIKVSAGICHSAAQTKSGRVFLWGCGSNGQTGDGSLPSSSPIREVRLDRIASLCKH